MVKRSPTHPNPIWTLGLTSVAFFMVALDALVVTTALPTIRAQVGGGLGTLEWVVTAYLLVFAAGIIPAAALGDRLGRRRVYVAGLILFVTASAACALAPSATVLIVARAAQGLGAATVTPLSLSILSAAFPAERRGAVLGIWGGIAGLAIAAGPLIGGGVTQGLNWHWIFWVNVPVGAVAAALAWLRLGESRGPARRLDITGAVLIAAAALAACYGLVRVTDSGWASVEVLAALAGGAALLAAFVAWERRCAAPMLPPALFSNRTFAAAAATAGLMSASITAAAFLVSQFFQLGLGYSPLGTGLRFLPWTATPLLVAPLAGALSDRIGRRRLLAAGLFVQAVGLVSIAAVASTSTGFAELLPLLIISGVGISMAIPTATAAAMNAVTPQELGAASGTTNMLQRLGGVLGVALVATAFSSAGHLGSAASVVAGFRPALTIAAGFSLLGALAALAMPHARVLRNADQRGVATAVAEAA